MNCGEKRSHMRLKVQSVASQPEPSPPGLTNVKNPIISNPFLGVPTLSVDQGQTPLSAPNDKPDSLTSKVESYRTSPNSEDQIVSHDERDLLSSKEPTLNLLVEIDPDPHRGRDETTYEIASDTWSPAMTVSFVGGDQHEEEYDIDVFPSHSLESLNGSSLRKEQHITVPPHGPKPGEQEVHALGAIVAGNNLRYDPGDNEQNGLGGVTSSDAEERCEGVRSDFPTSTTFDSRGGGVESTNPDNLPHDPSRTRRSKTGSSEAYFHCRICLSDPTSTSNLTATHCGHLFCYECIAKEVLRTSRCPVCKNVLALYCLFKLDVGS